MGVNYHVYGNGGSGPIDYSTVLATVTGTTWTPPALQPGTAWRFGVRSFDQASGMEESNIDAAVLIQLDASGNDLGLIPTSPEITSAVVVAGSSVLVHWIYAVPMGTRATNFVVTLTPASGAATSKTVLGGSAGSYATVIGGLTANQTATVSVVAVFGGINSNPSTATVQGGSTPATVDNLTASVSNQPAA